MLLPEVVGNIFKVIWRGIFNVILEQWFSTFFVPRSITTTHCNQTTSIKNSNEANKIQLFE